MADNKQIVYLRGTLYWPKVLISQLHDNYNKDGQEWTFDLALDADGIKHAKQHKELNIKDKDDERGKFITFKQKFREDSDRSLEKQAIRIVEADGKTLWDQDKEIGNGSVADVKFQITDYGKGKYPGIYPRAIRVVSHVSYDRDDGFEPIESDSGSDADLDDDFEDIL